VFLDEIGNLPLELQTKVLRVLQERQFELVGGATIHTDVRVICATNHEMIDKRQFRADLFYRLSVFPTELWPLLDRPEDVRLLVQHFAMVTPYACASRSGAFQTTLLRLVRLIPGRAMCGNCRRSSSFPYSFEQGVARFDTRIREYLERGTRARDAGQVQRSHIRQTIENTESVIEGPDGAAARLAEPLPTSWLR
jgi:Sigma-54 interaction domain